MIVGKKYVFDLDNTLVYTNSLNNDSYNYALSMLGLPKIYNIERITRETIFTRYPNISVDLRNEILETKQEYFKKNLDRTVLNSILLKLLLAQKKEDCLLWTSATEDRAMEILRFYGIEKEFIGMIFGEKENMYLELERICKILKCKLEQIIFYEDNEQVIIKLLDLGVNVVKV